MDTKPQLTIIEDILDTAKYFSGKSRQNIMRLKVNRPAILEVLNVEDILPAFEENQMFTEEEVSDIMHFESRELRVCEFLYVLCTKTYFRGWYDIFRSSLLEAAADADNVNRTQYKVLVSFLDATIIYKLESQGWTFGNARLGPMETDLSRDSEENSIIECEDTKVETAETPETQSCREAPSVMTNFSEIANVESNTSIVAEPNDCYASLLENYSEIAFSCIQDEKAVYESMKNVEVVLEMFYKMATPAFRLAESDSVLRFINDAERHHLYIKHLKKLANHYSKNIFQDITASFIAVINSFVDNDELQSASNKVVSSSFMLVDFLIMNGNYDEADSLLDVMTNLFAQKNKHENFMPLFKCYTYIMHVCNLNYNFQETNNIYFRAMEVVWKIEKLSFGQKLVNYENFYVELSVMLYEIGSLTSAYIWSYKALQELGRLTGVPRGLGAKSIQESAENRPAALVHVLCNCLRCCCCLWNSNKARDLALQTVRLAKKLYGVRHPVYVNALLHCCHYINEFQRNQAGVDIAEYAVKTSSCIYNCDTLQRAYACLALSEALTQANMTYNDERYYQNCIDALEIAKVILPNNHTSLYQFYAQFARVLHVRAMQSADSNTKKIMLDSAVMEVQQAQNLIHNAFHDVCLPMAQLSDLLGKIYTSKEEYVLAEECLQESVRIYSCCLSSSNNSLLQAKAKLAGFYRTVGDLQKSFDILTAIVNNIDTESLYYDWVHACFEELIILQRHHGSTADAEATKLKLVRWLASSMQKKQPDVTVDELAMPPEPFTHFLNDFNKWHKTVYKMMQQGLITPKRRSLAMLSCKSV